MDGAISRSTVYRTAKHFANTGIARCIHKNDGITYRDPLGDQSCQLSPT